MQNHYNKNRKHVYLLLWLLIGYQATHAQYYYSSFSSPGSGTNYWASTGGVCIGCSITNPSYTVSTSLTDSGRVILSVGVLNSATIRMKLTDSANSTASVIVKDNGGTMLLSNTTIKTYYNGTLSQSFSGSGITNTALSGSKRELSVAANSRYNEVEIVFTGFLSLTWDMYVYYAKGLRISALPLKLVHVEGNLLSNNFAKINWSCYSTEPVKAFRIKLKDQAGKTSHSSEVMASVNSNQISNHSATIVTGQELPGAFSIETIYSDGRTEESPDFQLQTLKLSAGTLNIYPHPAGSTFRLHSGWQQCTLEIHNAEMQLLKTEELSADDQEIDISQIPSGVYLLLVRNGCSQQSLRLNINR